MVKIMNFIKWFLRSFEENNGKTSGKSLTAFSSMGLVIISVIVALIFAENHVLPEFMFYGLIGTILTLLGVKTFFTTKVEVGNKKDEKNENIG
jgi:cadmium resistance protein CadD (predicted permease)